MVVIMNDLVNTVLIAQVGSSAKLRRKLHSTKY